MNTLKCVLSGAEVTKLGGLNSLISDKKSFDPTVDGFSANIGVVHKDNMSLYRQLARGPEFDADDARAQLEARMGISIISKQAHNRAVQASTPE